MRKLILLTAFFLISVVSLSIAADEKQKVRAAGMSAIHNNFIDIARDKAIDNALRSAVERIVGVMVTGSTEVENFQLKLDRILSESKGFIDSYKILSEKRDGDTYEVTVEAEVIAGKLQDRLKAVDLVMTRKSKPRVMIIFGEQAQKDAIAEAAMSRYLLSRGFKLVDAQTVKKNRADLMPSAAGNEKALSGIAQSRGAEIVIAGSIAAESHSFTMSGIEMFTNKVDVSVKVINSDTGDVITTYNESRSAPGPKGEIGAITKDAVEKLSSKIIEETLEHWSSELTNTTTVKLVVSGLEDYNNLLDFKDRLPLVVKGFKALYQRSYMRGKVDLDIEIKGSVQGLADDLSVLTIKEKRLQIMEITPNRVAATFQHN